MLIKWLIKYGKAMAECDRNTAYKYYWKIVNKYKNIINFDKEKK